MNLKAIFFPLFLFCFVILSACVNAPYTSRSQFIITSEEDEKKLGEDAWQQLKEESKISTDLQYTEPVLRVGKKLEIAVNEKTYDWQFMVIESEEMNAFCLPGGKVVVYTRLFQFLDNDAELATVMGHEIGHAIARHGGERITQLYMQQLGGAAASVVLSSAQVSSDWMTVYGAATNLGLILPYSRTQEYEGDYIGLLLMAKAGYDPKAALTFWQKFAQINDYGPLKEFLATHPMGQKRIEELKALLPEAQEIYSLANPKLELGESIKIKASAEANK